MPGFTALLTGLGLAAAELGGELPLVITGDEEVGRVPARAVNQPSKIFNVLVEDPYSLYMSIKTLCMGYWGI